MSQDISTSAHGTKDIANLHILPAKVLQNIFNYLTFKDISNVREISKNLYQVARQRLNSAFLELSTCLSKEYSTHLSLLVDNDATKESLADIIFRGRFLKLLEAEHSTLLAFFRNYLSHETGCFSYGEILDLFYDLLQCKCSPETQNEENKQLAKLILLIDRCIDWIESVRMFHEESCSWYGTCIVDLLDSCLASKHYLVISRFENLTRFSGHYVINGYSEIPPKISEPLGNTVSTKELLQLLRYLRKHIRWSNFTYLFKDDKGKKFCVAEYEEQVVSRQKEESHETIFKKRQIGMDDSDVSNVCLSAMVNLYCDQRNLPSKCKINLKEYCKLRRIKFTEEEESFETEAFLSNPESNETRNLREFVKISDNSPLQTLREGEINNKTIESRNQNYSFSLEIRCVHPKRQTSSRSNVYNINEQFRETTLHINHTPDSAFVAQTECNLY